MAECNNFTALLPFVLQYYPDLQLQSKTPKQLQHIAKKYLHPCMKIYSWAIFLLKIIVQACSHGEFGGSEVPPSWKKGPQFQ